MVYLILTLITAVAAIEGIWLRSIARKCRKQQLKVRLLEEIIEERFMEYEEGIDRR